MANVIKEAFYADNALTTTAHYHDCHQILFIKNGLVEFELNNETYLGRSGDILIFSRYGNHLVKVISDIYERYVVRINPTGIDIRSKEYSIFLNRSSKSRNIFSIKEDTSEFVKIFDNLVKEKRTDDCFSEKMQQILINQLLIMIYRNNPKLFEPFEEEKFDMVFELQKRLESNCREQYTLENLAKECHTSVSTLSHQFKKITGFSVFEYLFSCRIATAKNLLTKTNLNISEIVEQSGFSDSSNFSRAFKNSVGLTPSQFRGKYKRS